MVVDRFSSFDQLEGIRSRWTELYENDPQANLFLSWEWLSACLTTERRSWMVLGVRDGEQPHLAFLPLSFGRFPKLGPALNRELSLGPSPRADFTGMVSTPEEAWRIIPALAREIERLPWDSFALTNCADPRVAALVGEFVPSRYRVALAEPTPCPYVRLPRTWEEYLDGRGRSTRRTIRSHLRRLESLPGYRLHFPPLEEADQAVEALLRLHSMRWKKDLRKWRRVFGELLKRCYASGRFQVCAMYQGENLMAAQGFFVDRNRGSIVAYMIAHNPVYAQYSPGMMLGCVSIRRAIEEGYACFSLSRGAQDYKMSLATDLDYLTNTTLSRKGVRIAALNAGKSGFAAAKRLARNLSGRVLEKT
jgi:CelD/BcsL family acetyltransferase involved in cellulose biosynthesis